MPRKRDTFWYEVIVPIYDGVNRLMLEQQDWSGLAVSYGLQANMYLFTLKEYDKALELLQKDLDLVEKYHFVQHESSFAWSYIVGISSIVVSRTNSTSHPKFSVNICSQKSKERSPKCI